MTDACKHGHPFDEANTYIRPDFGWRQCRKCNLERWHKRRNNFAKSEKTS